MLFKVNGKEFGKEKLAIVKYVNFVIKPLKVYR